MGELIQIKANEDGCTYMYNVDTKTWQNLSNIENAHNLPDSVKAKILDMQLSTAQQ